MFSSEICITASLLAQLSILHPSNCFDLNTTNQPDEAQPIPVSRDDTRSRMTLANMNNVTRLPLWCHAFAKFDKLHFVLKGLDSHRDDSPELDQEPETFQDMFDTFLRLTPRADLEVDYDPLLDVQLQPVASLAYT